MIYLDNAATTHKRPKTIMKAALKSIKNSSNPGRGGHDLSLLAGAEVFEVREKLNNFFNGYGPLNVVFTSSCTQSLNLAILGNVKKGGHIVATMLEHNSVLRPLQELKNKGLISFSIAKPNAKGFIDLECIKKEIKPNTYLIITTHISNITGAKTEIEKIGKFAKNKNLIYLVDGAQSAGHVEIDMQKSSISMLAIPSHKGIMGICGGGALLIDPKIELKPIIYGGTGSSSINLNQPTTLPEGFESGTLPTPAIASMGAGISYIEKKGKKIKNKIELLSKYLIENLRNIEGITLYSSFNTGVISFNVKDYPSTDIAQVLNDKYRICTRAGLHCAPLAHEFLNTTSSGAVRVSLSYFTRKKEIDYLIKALKEITQ